jgi:hypothetical protein
MRYGAFVEETRLTPGRRRRLGELAGFEAR